MKLHKRKMIAPIVVALVLAVYYAAYFALLVSIVGGVWKYLLGLIPIAFFAVTVAVCIERIKEIKRGEEDDIGKY